MATFTYTAIERKSGRSRRGSIEGASPGQAAAMLKEQGLAPTALQIEVPPSLPPKVATSVSERAVRKAHAFTLVATLKRRLRMDRTLTRRSVTLFTRQLATLVNAGMPLVRGLEVLQRQERNQAAVAVLSELADTISAGGTLSDGLQRHPRTFDPLYINMVKAGEAGGALGMVLARLAQYLEKSARLTSRVKTAMIYPVIITVVAASILSVLMVFVVPKFELIFSGLLRGQPLPALTRGMLGVSGFLRSHVVFIGTVGPLAWAGFRLMRKTSWGERSVDWALLRLPVVGDLALKALIARFARTLGSLLSSGVPILEALAITRTTSGNVHVSQALGHVHDRIKQGDSITEPLGATGIFPGMVTGMIQVGEETGALPDMLGRIADIYDEEVDNAVAGLTSVIEPIMIVLMALVVGVIVIALFLPIVSVIQHLQ